MLEFQKEMGSEKMFSFEKEAIKRATEKLRNVLGHNLIAVVVFGSRVRGDFDGDSDFDILIVVKKRTSDVIDEAIDVFTDEEDKMGVPFSVVIKEIKSFEKERTYNTTFYRNIKREGVFFYGQT